MTEPGTVTAQLEELERRGFGAHFGVVGHAVQVLNGGRTFRSDELAIREYYRFEGVSDPGDMSIVYAIESHDGARGTLVDAFGTYSDPAVTEFMDAVQDRDVEVVLI